MAIKGISEKRMFYRAWKFRIGNKKNGNPNAVDYFIPPPEIAEQFAAIYGDKPKVLNIMLLGNTQEENIPQFMKKHGSGGLKCIGDNETGEKQDKVNGNQSRECNPKDPWCKDCKPKAKLNFVIMELPGIGVCQIDTSSYNSIVFLNNTFDVIRRMTGDNAAFVPLILKLVPHTGKVTQNGKTFDKVVYCMILDIPGKIGDFIEQYGWRANRPANGIDGLVLTETDDMNSQANDNLHPVWEAGIRRGLSEDQLKVLIWVTSKYQTDSYKDLSEKQVKGILISLDEQKNSLTQLLDIAAEYQPGYDQWLAEKNIGVSA